MKVRRKQSGWFRYDKTVTDWLYKTKSDTSWRTFNLLLQNACLDDQISNLYVVDIEFDHGKATEKQLVYNEIYPPIIEKQKIIDPCEKPVYQLLEQNSSTEKEIFHNLTEQPEKHTQLWSKKNFNLCI